jgi:hypothetical protein
MKKEMRFAVGKTQSHEVKLDYNPKMEATLPAWL